MGVIKVTNALKYYQYMGYLTEAIREKTKFRYHEVNQLGARLSGKTTSDNLELIRAIIEAKKQNASLVVFIFRMRHKDSQEAWSDIIKLLRNYRLPFIVNRGLKIIRL